MLYNIEWSPEPHDRLQGCSFNIRLFPAWREAIAGLGWDQAHVDAWVADRGAMHLRRHFPASHFPELGEDIQRPLPHPAILQVLWGEWGPERIVVPGDATSLYLDHDSIYPGGATLASSNMDTMLQASLCLTIFCWVATAASFHILNQQPGG